MKWSPILHFLTIAAVIFAVVAWFAAGWAGLTGVKVFGIWSSEHLYNDAIVAALLSIAFALGVLIHRQKEQGL